MEWFPGSPSAKDKNIMGSGMSPVINQPARTISVLIPCQGSHPATSIHLALPFLISQLPQLCLWTEAQQLGHASVRTLPLATGEEIGRHSGASTILLEPD